MLEGARVMLRVSFRLNDSFGTSDQVFDRVSNRLQHMLWLPGRTI